MIQLLVTEKLEARWNDCRDGQILVDSTHPLKLLLSLSADGNKQLFIPVNKVVKGIVSSSAIKVFNVRSEEQLYFVIELINPVLVNEFVYLCVDLIEKSRMEESCVQSLKILFDTFEKWQQLFDETRNNLLTNAEIKGLIGELLFIANELKKDRSEDSIISAWKTKKDASRDFIFEDEWYEIKSVSSTSDYVSISSIEQLDHEKEGYLLVNFIDYKPSKNNNALTLPSLIILVANLMRKSAVIAEFYRKLLEKGYTYESEYDDAYFEFCGREKYLVNNTFPKIARRMLPVQITTVKYEINLTGIKDWIVGD